MPSPLLPKSGLRKGVPANPRAWLVSTGRFKAIDILRRRTRFDASLADLASKLDTEVNSLDVTDDSQVEDDRLRLIFTCCHPALSPEAQVALTLREVCGLTTEEIASAFLVSPTTLAQRIVRAKAKIRDAGIPYQVPSKDDLPDRLETVLQVIYLVFNEGYAASSGPSVIRGSLSEEAIRLGRLLMALLPDAEVIGLLALMLLQASRRTARTSPTGDLILLEDQDRSLWNREQIIEGLTAFWNEGFCQTTTWPMLPRLGKTAAARASYEQALALAKQEPERRFLEKRLQELG
jgi:RNA polymerase sigma-70 factor (ECF subfamily)